MWKESKSLGSGLLRFFSATGQRCINLTASGSLMTTGLHSSTSKLSQVVILVPCPLSLQNVPGGGEEVEGIVVEHVP